MSYAEKAGSLIDASVTLIEDADIYLMKASKKGQIFTPLERELSGNLQRIMKELRDISKQLNNAS